MGRRLGLAFAITIAFAAAQGALSIYYLSTFSQNVTQMFDEDLLGIRALDRARSQLNRIQFALAEHVAADDVDAMRAVAEKIQADRYQLSTWSMQVKSTASGAVKQKISTKIDTALGAYLEAVDGAVLPLSEQGNKSAAAGAILKLGENELRRLSILLDDLADFDANAAQTRREYTEADYRSAVSVLAAIGAIALMFGLGVAVAVTRSVTRPLHQAASIADRVASGDLTSDIEIRGDDETARLLGALKTMNENLARIVHDVYSGAARVNSAAREIDGGNLDLSRRTEEQASSLEQTAASMEELTVTVRQNADGAHRATDLAATVQSTALRGAELMSDVVHTMNLIDHGANRVAQIIKLIDDIAFQTNLLALNAAVEAARAGNEGRGFAVVASEVRSLAMRSASAAQEIKALVGNSVESVGAGKQQVAHAGHNMSEIVAGIKALNAFVGEISTASEEQSSGLEQASQAISHLDDITQRNAELVQSAGDAARDLRQQAQSLLGTVRIFKVRTGGMTAQRSEGLASDKPQLPTGALLN